MILGLSSCSMSLTGYERSSPRTLCTQIRFLWSFCPTAEPAFPSLQTRMLCLDALNSLAAMGLVGQQLGSACHPDASATRSAQSTDRVNREAPGWTKRLRLGSAPPGRTPCPSWMSALEQSIGKYAEEPTKSVIHLTGHLDLSLD